jgi:hypothetical protein
MLKEALPAVRVITDELLLPQLRPTEPVGVPPVPLTVTVTEVCDRACTVVMLAEPGVTVTVGVFNTGGGGVVDPPSPPPPHEAIPRIAAMLNQIAACRPA